MRNADIAGKFVLESLLASSQIGCESQSTDVNAGVKVSINRE